ncbi:medium chain dehydrogenase/reductase family protein [Loktanella sp. M215]|uniref:medium chain dehydrogenase/reductase family protein n=1 Tax=Loktanella sp. M215 TaxID=2675431 RepID=UPI001F220D6F|nr:medium chain dehydrogenase/reductase family protein [Loktanella sp. M215]MCF7702406.1 zinc-binding dehydrogenase [Loktanella sp. M215]
MRCKNLTDIDATRMTTQIVLPGVVAPSGLQVRQVGIPVPGANQVLLHMEASGVSFAEKAMRRGRYPMQPKFPFVPGYDVVGKVLEVGPGGDPSMIGRRVAAALKTGGWATHVLVSADEIVPVPGGVAAADAETVIVNGVTAWQMLYRKAQAKPGQTTLVLGASSGVGTILAQLAIADGMRVIGTASPRHHAALKAFGVEPIDYADPDVAARVRALSPCGVDAVFDHLGPSSVRQSFGLLDQGGILVVYGIAADLDKKTAMLPRFLGLLATLSLWSALPNGRRAMFYDFWQGMLTGKAVARQRRREDMAKVMEQLATGAIKPMIAATFPLIEVAAAMEKSEARGLFGKVVIVP